MKAKIAKWGNSVAVRLPKAALEATGLQAGAEVDVVVEGRELRLKQVVRTPHYTLEELLAEMDRLGPESRPALVDWGPDVGAEIIDDDYSRGLIPAPGGGSRVGRPGADAGTRAGRRPARRRTHRS
jgi:antitoxin MazE